MASASSFSSASESVCAARRAMSRSMNAYTSNRGSAARNRSIVALPTRRISGCAYEASALKSA